jgi:signal transduction histidine kinase
VSGSSRGYAASGVTPALPAWLPRPSQRTRERALIFAVSLLVIGTAINQAQGESTATAVISIAASLFVIPALVLRKRRPGLALGIIVAAGLCMPSNVMLALPAIIVVYTIAATGSLQAATTASAAVVAASIARPLIWNHLGAGELVTVLLECAVAVAFGLNTASRRATMDALRDRAERLDRERELLAERAVTEERLRLARELHDAVGHDVSLMIVQAQALGATSADESVHHATTGIADFGRHAMAELQRTLNLLRSPIEDGATRAPRPGLAALEALLEQSRAGGLAVELQVEGAPVLLSASLDLSAYRIVQEALTNVRRHAGPARATVTIGYRPDALELTIVDTGTGAAANGSGGHGITGMRERAAMFGGTLTAGPQPERGYAVRATLPYEATPS